MSDKDDEEMFQQFIEEMMEFNDEDGPFHGCRSAEDFKRRDPRGYEIAKREYLANHPLE